MRTSPTRNAVFIGVHLAVDRVHSVAVTEYGEILVEAQSPYSIPFNPVTVKGQLELNAEVWWDATRMSLGQLITKLKPIVASPSQLKSISVCSQPGAILTVDRNGNPVLPAILAPDNRGADYIKSLNYHGQEYCERMGFQFKAESPLAKIAWIKENMPELYEDSLFIHQADFILNKLKGAIGVTEFSLALKTGCDLLEECWPDWIDYDMHLGVRERLPRLVHLGEKVGAVSQKASAATGLPTGMTVIMGTTAATASFLASGARKLGDVHNEIQNGMTISGIAPKMVNDQHGLIQSYKLPGGAWFTMVESNTGAEWVNKWFADSKFEDLVQKAETLLPTTYLAYPNVSKGETFPFVSSSAEGFISPATDNRTAQFASCLQGSAMFERYCYQKLDKLSGNKGTLGDVYSGGEWSAVDSWMQCRADVTGRVNYRMTGHGGAAFGTAMMAAMGSNFGNLEATAEAMLSTEAVFYPSGDFSAQYNELYGNFCLLMEEQGYTI
jgi:sugar (pentulose or hexulose) kinase